MATSKNKKSTSKDHAVSKNDIASKLQERIVSVGQERVGDYLPSPHNPRVHGDDQVKHFETTAGRHGKVGVLMAYTGDDGLKYLFNGHMRQSFNPDELWYVAMTDLTEAEIKELFTVYDYLGDLAETDQGIFAELLLSWTSDDERMIDALLDMHGPALVLESLDGNVEADSVLGDLTSAAEDWEPVPVAQPAVVTPPGVNPDNDDGYFDASTLPDAPAARENERSYLLYVTFASEETFERGLKALSMNPKRGIKLPGQRFARIDGEFLVAEYERGLLGLEGTENGTGLPGQAAEAELAVEA